MYDAVMSIGFGACNAQIMAQGRDEASSAISGLDHHKGIRSADFWGSTGRVQFGAPEYNRYGTRKEDTVVWAAVNWRPLPEFLAVSDIIDPSAGNGWTEVAPVMYGQGRDTPPPVRYVPCTQQTRVPSVCSTYAAYITYFSLSQMFIQLRDMPEQNYLSNSLRALGLALMGVTMMAAVVCAVWVFICRKHKILAASQPMFLYMICLGCFTQTSAILPASVDESHGWSEQQLDRACMSVPWLLALGHIIVYSALFTKLWRVNQVLQFTRRQIQVRHVAWPMALLVLAALVVLMLWTLLDPFHWNREEINEFTSESIGKCESNSAFAFVGPLIGIMLIPTVLTCVMAYKTKDVDETYTESWWIFILIVVQVEVTLIAVPVIVILNGESTDGRYLGFVFLLWSFPMTTLGLLFIPKMISYRNDIRGLDTSSKYKRGERKNIRVTGVVASASGGTGSPSDGSFRHDSVRGFSSPQVQIPESAPEEITHEQ